MGADALIASVMEAGSAHVQLDEPTEYYINSAMEHLNRCEALKAELRYQERRLVELQDEVATLNVGLALLEQEQEMLQRRKNLFLELWAQLK